MPKSKSSRNVTEIAVIGEVDDWEADVVRSLLDLPPRSRCVYYIDSTGGSVYGALAVLTLMRHREVDGTAIVLGECSSAALLLFAACRRRIVTPFSTLFFHRMRWQSDKRVASDEATLWAQHFVEMEKELDALQVRLFGTAEDKIRAWTAAGSFISGPEAVAAGLAEMMEI
jgi:ATP-dependent protease ClpP protease subunit